MSWLRGPLLAFDTETTGIDVERDYILSASLVHIRPGQQNLAETLYLNWEVDIPAGAFAVHKLSRQFLAEHGGDPADALEAVCLVVAAAMEDTPLVGMNVTFDLTMLDRNCRRVGVQPLGERRELAPVIDAFVLDKQVDPYRKGKRNLAALAGQYRVPWDEDRAHGSEFDALAAARVAWRIGRVYPPIGRMSAEELHRQQMVWKMQQDHDFADYLRKQGKPTVGVDGCWPIKPWDPRDPAVQDPWAEPPQPSSGILEDVPLW